jgi:hypothetical protein
LGFRTPYLEQGLGCNGKVILEGDVKECFTKSIKKLTTLIMYLGKLFGFPHFSTQNFLGPVLPLRAANPSYGILDVPVTNCSNRSRCSLLNRSMAVQNHCITG